MRAEILTATYCSDVCNANMALQPAGTRLLLYKSDASLPDDDFVAKY